MNVSADISNTPVYVQTGAVLPTRYPKGRIHKSINTYNWSDPFVLDVFGITEKTHGLTYIDDGGVTTSAEDNGNYSILELQKTELNVESAALTLSNKKDQYPWRATIFLRVRAVDNVTAVLLGNAAVDASNAQNRDEFFEANAGATSTPSYWIDSETGSVWIAAPFGIVGLGDRGGRQNRCRGLHGHLRVHGLGRYGRHRFVRMVEQTQTSHLPDAFDPTPIAQDIGVYYTGMIYGRLGMTILEDRKFKTGPDDPPPEVEQALLGERQHEFLRTWNGDWSGQDVKFAVSQTPFVNAHTHSGRKFAYKLDDKDTNGWPPHRRVEAVDLLRRSYMFQLAGDQHQSTVLQHGIDGPRDAGERAILIWDVTGGTRVAISPDVGNVDLYTVYGIGEVDVGPVETTTYTLTSEDAEGNSLTAEATVDVR